MFANRNTKARSAFIAATIAALLIAFASNLQAQSPLTVQPSTGRVGVGNTNPAETLGEQGTGSDITICTILKIETDIRSDYRLILLQ